MARSIHTRRCQTFLVSSSMLKLPGAPTNAEVTIDPTGSNNTLIWRSVKPGIAGNLLSVTYNKPSSVNQTLGHTFLNNSLVLNLATDGSAIGTTTAQNLIDYVQTNLSFSYIFNVVASGTVSGLIPTTAKQPLIGGAIGTGDFAIPFTNAKIYIETNGVRIRSDLTDPTSSVGVLWPAAYVADLTRESVNYREYLENLRFIRSSGSDASVSVEYLSI